jgi:hypothetical protein
MTMKTLLLIYRPVLLLFLGVITPVVVVVDILFGKDVPGGLWVIVVGAATRYWLLVIGILLATMQLRVFVANGVTRRDFTAGAARFGLVVALALAVVVVAGQTVESAILAGATPEIGGILAGFVRQVVFVLAFGVGGWLIGTAYFRLHPLVATLLNVPVVGAVALTSWLLGTVETGPAPLALPAAVPIGLALVALGYLVVRRLTADIAIRRTAG